MKIITNRNILHFVFALVFGVISMHKTNGQCQYIGNSPALFEPPNGEGCYLIIGQNNRAIENYYDNVGGPTLAGGTMYTNAQYWGVETAFVDRNGNCEYNYLTEYRDDPNYDNTFLHIGYNFAGNDNATRIVQDREGWRADMRSFAIWVKNCGRPVFLRIGFEAELQYGVQFADFYKEVWREMVGIFRAENVENCAYVFQVAYGEGGWEPFYPGDEYVDWVGYSQWQNTIAQNFLNWAQNTVRKPVLICESAQLSGSCSVDQGWLSKINSWVKQNPIIKGWAYINYNWVGQSGGCGGGDEWSGCWPVQEGWGNTELHTSQQAKDYWLNTIVNDDYYIKSSETLFQDMYSNFSCTNYTDCNGTQNGNAYLDRCGTCVGGTTGADPCDYDCNGVLGGDAYVDPDCKKCVGGTTGRVCEADCFGEKGGSAFVDVCNECVGGNTGKKPCVSADFEVDHKIVQQGKNVNAKNKFDEDITADYNWNFGANANPGTSDQYGPHAVNYNATGARTITQSVSNVSGSDNKSVDIEVINARTPYNNSPMSIPGTIQFENYDANGSNVSYFDDTPGNNCNTYRSDDVDVCFATSINEHFVGFCSEGEWLEYTINIQQEGYYTFDITTASNANTGAVPVDITIDGAPISTRVYEAPITANWEIFETHSVEHIFLKKADNVLMRVEIGGEVNLDKIVATYETQPDCNGDIGGNAYLDLCNVCVGGTTGREPCPPVSINDQEESALRTYPNPAQDVLNIEGINSSVKTVQIYDAQGFLKMTSTVVNEKVDISELASGIYVLKVAEDRAYQFVKQ